MEIRLISYTCSVAKIIDLSCSLETFCSIIGKNRKKSLYNYKDNSEITNYLNGN